MRKTWLVMAVLGMTVAFGQAPSFAEDVAHGGAVMPDLVIAAPANGALIEGALSVKFALKDRGPLSGARSAAGDTAAPASSDSLPPRPGEYRAGAPRVYLLIDTPLPETGSMVYVDGAHQPFPMGEDRLSVTLRPGRHRLQLLVVGQDGKVGDAFITSPSVMVTVQ